MIKCVVWDLDNTLWEGVLLEGDCITLFPNIIDVIKTLDQRGILHSIASRNDLALAQKKLEAYDLWQYFVYPQINWGDKNASFNNILRELNINQSAIAFIDDQPFERELISFYYPDVLCIDAKDTAYIINDVRFKPTSYTEETPMRRHFYQLDAMRKGYESNFRGTQDEFLKSLEMFLSIRTAKKEDLMRVEELTLRTHQLNTTGYIYTYQELLSFLTSDNHSLYVTSLDDKFGPYGTIGLLLVEKQKSIWTLKLFILSCRVMSRNIGGVLLSFIMRLAKKNQVRLRAEFRKTNVNRMMYITYKFNGFAEVTQKDEHILLELDNNFIVPHYPSYFSINIDTEEENYSDLYHCS